jgi:hypothetical protein
VPSRSSELYVTALDVSHIYRWKLAYVYRQARKHRWRRIIVDGEVRYFRADVHKTYEDTARPVDPGQK